MPRVVQQIGTLTLLAWALAGCSTTGGGDRAPLPEVVRDGVEILDRWSTSVGEGSAEEVVFLEPAVESPVVIMASRDGVLKAVGRVQGDRRWQIRLDEGILAGVSVREGLLALATATAELQLRRVTDGSLVWKAPLGATLLARPVLGDRQVVVQTLDGRLQSFDRETGARQWTFDTPVPPLSLRGNAAPVISGDKLFAVSGQGDLYQMDLQTGLPVWQTRVTNSRGRGEIERLMDIDGDLVLDPNGTLYTAGYQSQITATDTLQVRRRWQLNISTTQAVATDAAHVYAVDTNGSVAGINKLTGELVWLTDFKDRQLSAPVIWRGLVVVTDQDGYLHALSPSDGRVRARVRAAREPLMSVQVDAPQLLTVSQSGRLRAWELTAEAPRNP